jgi:hypothetical protein
MTDVEWGACSDASLMLRLIRGKCGDRKLRLLACACARSRWSGLIEDEYRRAVEVAERCADGLADRAALRAAESDIWDMLWGEVPGEPDANGAAEACVDDFAGNAAERAVASLPTGAVGLVREILGNPLRAVVITPNGVYGQQVTELARKVYDEHRFEELPRLADLLSRDGCRDESLLAHLRSGGPHFRGCWALDTLLTKDQGKDLVTEQEWLSETHPFDMLKWWEYYRGKPSVRKHRLLACACCRLTWHLMTDECLRQAVEMAEAYTDGLADPEELARLHRQARALGLARGEVLSQMSGSTPDNAALTDAWRSPMRSRRLPGGMMHSSAMRCTMPRRTAAAGGTQKMRRRRRLSERFWGTRSGRPSSSRPGGRRTFLLWPVAFTKAARSTACQSSQTPSKRLAATMTRSSNTVAVMGRMYAGAGWWIWSWASRESRYSA